MAQQPLRQPVTTTSNANDSMLQKLQASELERQHLLTELRNLSVQSDAKIGSLHDANQCLRNEVEDLRNLCISLDDENQQYLHLAAEWQKFGQYTASVVQSELADFKQKLKELEVKQATLLKENTELKELCLYLADLQQIPYASTCTTSVFPDAIDEKSPSKSPNSTLDRFRRSDKNFGPNDEKKTSDNLKLPIDEMKQYVHFLEMRVSHLEEENQHLSNTNMLTGKSLQRSQSTTQGDWRTFAVTAEPPKPSVRKKVDYPSTGGRNFMI